MTVVGETSQGDPEFHALLYLQFGKNNLKVNTTLSCILEWGGNCFQQSIIFQVYLMRIGPLSLQSCHCFKVFSSQSITQGWLSKKSMFPFEPSSEGAALWAIFKEYEVE